MEEGGFKIRPHIHNIRHIHICDPKGWGQSAKLQQLVDHFPSDQ